MPDAGSFSFFPSQSRNPPFSIESCKRDVCVCVLQDDLATVMTEYRCHFTEEASNKYQTYIKSATHRSGESTPLFSPLSLSFYHFAFFCSSVLCKFLMQELT